MKKIALIIGSMIAGGIISAAGFTWLDLSSAVAADKARLLCTEQGRAVGNVEQI